ncbi:MULTISPECIES: cytochrome c biogenesis protein [unclassified Coleofasciculus]|uniref:cytochrome c biogenesis protein n=1 Tax=unclassified Coleofasciculus TaxID=2692782 RepID=UPI001883100A|nr:MULTISPECIES: cytochrome c biogenesis protein CcsA [unclassified Coleofasciculus]MBE9127178.1 cytochrome c biogenesis protein CcsA [Coleofasciculus sp. LEGE 07081]MBE9150499.1 cytochrome c biogenesis protein CcsA [Coleofasciculus sp. LEGE 07092]
MKLLKFLIGLSLGLLILVIPFNSFQTSSLEPLQTLAVQLEGRKKPLDTVARETVVQIHGRTHYRTENGETLNYLQTYLSLWFNNRDWNQEPFIFLNYRPLKEQIGLNPKQKYFTFQELIGSQLSSIILQARQKQADDSELTRDEREALTIEDRLALMLETVGTKTLPLVPHPTDSKGKWVGLSEAKQYYEPGQVAPLLADYESMKAVYLSSPTHDVALAEIAKGLQQKLAALSSRVYPDTAVLNREVSFYQLHPFGKAWVVYAIAFCAMLLVLLFNSDNFYWGSVGIFTSSLLLHGYGFIERMQIAGRPPVTNMYESVIWVGFGISAIALLFELIYRAKYYLLAAAPLSVLCLVLADSLPAVLDPSIKPLVPVLRDNFWLSVHVPTITLSYASFALALGLGHIILGHYLFFPHKQKHLHSLSKWNYGVLQVGVLLLTTGIILGGIWAHFSWGRFWGWDPKETWALIALMCYIVPLHGRLVGWLGDFGMAVTSVVSFNAVLMAWYGVNFVLGTGLHSYGFSTGGSELMVSSLVGADLLFVLAVTSRHKGWFPSKQTVSLDPKAGASEVPVQQS